VFVVSRFFTHGDSPLRASTLHLAVGEQVIEKPRDRDALVDPLAVVGGVGTPLVERDELDRAVDVLAATPWENNSCTGPRARSRRRRRHR
jgi:hypothetical protein